MYRSSTVARVATAVAAVALLGYVGLILFPPPAQPQWLVPPGTPFLQRLFPAVPTSWVLACAACLAIAFVAVAAAALADRRPAVAAEPRPATWTTPSRGSSYAIVAAAGVHVCAIPFASTRVRWFQLLYIAWLALPALLAYGAEREARRRVSLPADPTHWPAVALVLIVWLVLRGFPAIDSPLMAAITDTNTAYPAAIRAANPTTDLIGTQIMVGFRPALLVLQGPILLGLGPEQVTPFVVQAFEILWMLVAAALAARIVATFGVRGAAPVAAAAFLFSPLAAYYIFLLGPVFIGPLVPAVVIWLAVKAFRDKSGAALVACGAAAGLGTTHPSIAPAGLFAFAILVVQLRRSRPPAVYALAAALSFLAIALPGLPNPADIAKVAGDYSESTAVWTGLEGVLLGFVPGHKVEFVRDIGVGGPLDIVVGALVSPWLAPRTAIRLNGDVIFDPVSASLFTIGLAAAIFSCRRRAIGWGLIALQVLVVVPAFLSDYDRPSLSRAMALPLSFSLLAGFGFAWLGERISKPRVVAAAITLAIIAAGTVVFDIVNDRILPRSSISLVAAEVDGDRDCPDAVMLRPATADKQDRQWFAENVLRCSVATVSVDHEAWWSEALRHTVVFWSPDIETTHAASAALCAARPDLAIWSITDRSGLGRLYAASPASASWRPRLAASREDCPAGIETLVTLASTALADARVDVARGDTGTAIERLRKAALRTFVQTRLYVELARLLEGAEQRDEAAYWGLRAAASDDWSDFAAIEFYARLLQRKGDDDAARRALDRGIREASGKLDHDLEERLRRLRARMYAEAG